MPTLQQFYRDQIDQITRPGNPRTPFGGAVDFARDTTPGGLARNYPRRGLDLKSGQSASGQQLKEFMQQQGAPSNVRGANNGLTSTSTTTSNRKNQVARAAGNKSKRDAESDLDKFFREAEEKIEEANSANKSRRDDIMKRLDAKYNRVMGRIQNFGHAARADLQERSAEALGNIQANLSARGLGNSTIMASFIQRNQRDLAREQQRLSEQVDTRAMNADMAMTNQQTGFLERINENAPDYGQLMQLAQQYGRGNAGQGFTGGQQGNVDPNLAPGGTRTVANADGTSQTFTGPQPQQNSPLPGAVAAGRNRGPINWGDGGVGNFMQGIRNSQAPNGNYGGYNYTPTEQPQQEKPYKEYYKPGETDVPSPPQRDGNIANTLAAYGGAIGDAYGAAKDAVQPYANDFMDAWGKAGDEMNSRAFDEADAATASSRERQRQAQRQRERAAADVARNTGWTPPGVVEKPPSAPYIPPTPERNNYPFPTTPGMIPPPTNRTPEYTEAEDVVNSWRATEMAPSFSGKATRPRLPGYSQPYRGGF